MTCSSSPEPIQSKKKKSGALALTASCQLLCSQRRFQVQQSEHCLAQHQCPSMWPSTQKPTRCRKGITEPAPRVYPSVIHGIALAPRTQNCEAGQIRLVPKPKEKQKYQNKKYRQTLSPLPTQRLFYDAVLRCMQILFLLQQDRRPKDKGDV
jgi:hypothetical protein